VLINRLVSRREMEQMEAVKPHAAAYCSVPEIRWRNIRTAKTMFKGPLVPDNEARHPAIFRSSAEELGSFLVPEEIARAVPHHWGSRHLARAVPPELHLAGGSRETFPR
jgi:hypothetical protein